MCFLELFYYPSTLSFTLSKKKQELYGLLTFSKNNQRYYTIPIIVPPIITLDRCCFTCICYVTCAQNFELSTHQKSTENIKRVKVFQVSKIPVLLFLQFLDIIQLRYQNENQRQSDQTGPSPGGRG